MGLALSYENLNKWLPLDAKKALYQAGYYKFSATFMPPTTHLWTEQDWINYIDRYGAWQTEKLPLIKEKNSNLS